MPYSHETKLAELRYEIKMRKQVYPSSVIANRMRQSVATMKIEIMEEIARDYERAIDRRKSQTKEDSDEVSKAT
jgi:hypothetical protein